MTISQPPKIVMLIAPAVVCWALVGCGGGGTEDTTAAPLSTVNAPGAALKAGSVETALAVTAGSGAPTLSLSPSVSDISSGHSSTFTWKTTNASSCTASGAWTGSKQTSGIASTGPLTYGRTYQLSCSGAGGTTSASATVNVGSAPARYIPPSTGVSGLNFPSNGAPAGDVRFKFTGANLLAPYPATYIWRVNSRQQSGYYTTFFWGPDGAFSGAGYYGAHPYPTGSPSAIDHRWEVSIDGADTVNDANGNNTQVSYGAWHTQAMVVRLVNGNEIESRFYWNLPDTTKVIVHTTQVSDYAYTFRGAPYSGSALTFGDAPWSVGNERLSGVLRGIQLYASALSPSDMLTESSTPRSTVAGSNSLWYLNLNPTPSNISDQSGRGHHPTWTSSARPALWTP
jgi:hypothetical protein